MTGYRVNTFAKFVLRRARLSLFLLWLLSLIIVSTSNSIYAEHNKPYSEPQVKVALIYKLIHFVELADNSSLSLCVFQPNNEELSALKLIPHQTESGNRLTVKLIYETDKLLSPHECQVVYLSGDAKNNTSKILSYAASKGYLTIGATNQFIKQGGMINLVRRDAKIKFEINLPALKHAGLSISSKVLRIADKVHTEAPI